MKKTLALLLALVMMLGIFAACGKTEAPAETPAETPAEAPAEAPAEEPAEAPAEEPAAPVDDTTIIFSSTFSENETGGQIIAHFKESLEAATNGAIKVNVTYGGTLYGSPDELDAVSNGAVQMVALGHNPHADLLPLLCSIPDFAPDSPENALNYFNYVLFENEASSAALKAEAEAANVKYLNVIAGGANTFIANFEYSDLASLAAGSASFGNMEAAKFEALGFTVEAVLPWDYYSAFDTGLIDASQMGSTPLYSMSIYEVAPYWMYDNTYTAGNFFTVNLDWWNGLSAATQDAIQAAATETEEYSIQLYLDALATEADNLVAKGATLIEMSDADFETWWSAIMESKKTDAMANAETNGNVADCEAVLNAAAEFTGYTFK